MEHPKYQTLAVISGILLILGFSNLVLRVHTTRYTEHLTFIWFFLLLSGQALLMIYGILNNSYGIFIPPILMITGLLYILYIKLTYETNNKVESELRQKNII